MTAYLEHSPLVKGEPEVSGARIQTIERNRQMKLLIVGATGGLGRLLVEQALTAGHEITAFVRHPAAFQMQHEHLCAVRGDILALETVESAVIGQEVVLAAVSAKPRQKTTVFSQGVRNLVTAMEKHGVRRLIWVTSAGIDPVDAAAQGFLFDKVFKPLLLEDMYEDARLSEEVLQASHLEWMAIRPTLLTNGPYTGGTELVQSTFLPKGKGFPGPMWPILCSNNSQTTGMSTRLLRWPIRPHENILE